MSNQHHSHHTNHKNQSSDLVPELRFPEFEGEWIYKKVGELCDFIVPGRNKPQEFNGDIPWITTPDITHHRTIGTSKSGLAISKEEAKNVGSKVVPIHSVVISCVGELGIVADTRNEIVINQQLHAFIPLESVNYKFLLYELGNKKKYMERVATKTAVPYMNKDNCNSIPVNLPQPQEQQKIASFLTAVDKRIQLLEEKKENLERYKKGAMQQIFSQEIRFKDEHGNDFPDWEEKKLGEVCKLQGGFAFKSSKFRDEGIPIIRISNISNDNNYIDLNSIVYYDKIEKAASFSIKKGDLLIAMSGATTGKSSIYNLKDVAYLNQRVGLFNSISTTLYYPFLIQFVFSESFKKQLESLLVAGAQPNISSKDIESLVLPYPSLREQQKIASFLSAIDEAIEKVGKQIEDTQQFKKGLLQKMFV